MCSNLLYTQIPSISISYGPTIFWTKSTQSKVLYEYGIFLFSKYLTHVDTIFELKKKWYSFSIPIHFNGVFFHNLNKTKKNLNVHFIIKYKKTNKLKISNQCIHVHVWVCVCVCVSFKSILYMGQVLSTVFLSFGTYTYNIHSHDLTSLI